jgi:hypothetical protein
VRIPRAYVCIGVAYERKFWARGLDTITGRVEVTDVRSDKPITTLRTTVTRDDGTVALEGTAVCYTMAITA